jgi:hypothetical protein
MKEIAHGTRHRYNRLKCRCPACRAANAAYLRDYNARYRESYMTREALRQAERRKV